MATATKAQTPTSEKHLLSVRETSMLLGLSESLIWKEIKRGRLKPLRFGDRVLFSRVYLERLCEAR